MKMNHQDTPDDFTTIARFYEPTHAHLLRIALEEEGIECLILDEATAYQPHLILAVGGARVQVRKSQTPAALRILRETALDSGVTVQPEAPQAPVQCPYCGSKRIRTSAWRRLPPLFFLHVLICVFVALAPIRNPRRLPPTWRCLDCRRSWRSEPDAE